jgi:hypothetical protein
VVVGAMLTPGMKRDARPRLNRMLPGLSQLSARTGPPVDVAGGAPVESVQGPAARTGAEASNAANNMGWACTEAPYAWGR